MESPYDGETNHLYFQRTRKCRDHKNKSASKCKDALSKIESIFKKFNPEQPFEYQFVDEEYAKKFGDEERIGKLASFFAILGHCYFLSGFIWINFFCSRTTKKRNWCKKSIGCIGFQCLEFTFEGFCRTGHHFFFIAVPLSWYFMHKWLQNYSYRINISWRIFLIAGIIAITIALITVSFQAIKAAVASPVKTLRTE